MTDIGLGLAQMAFHPDTNSTKITPKAGNLQKVAKQDKMGRSAGQEERREIGREVGFIEERRNSQH